MVGFQMDAVREIASSHDYVELAHNETSRVLSFRTSGGGSTRINVYYTTGTVGTCLNHPRQGKTQLFRRNVTLDILAAIFANPRLHTGEGYYCCQGNRQEISQLWRTNTAKTLEWDSAQRWRYVVAATGLSKTLDAIVDICNDWDNLYWEPDQPPDIKGTKFSCGSSGTLMHMLLQVAHDEGCYKFASLKKLKLFKEGLITKAEIDAEKSRYSHDCDNKRSFLEAHGNDVASLKRRLRKLPKVEKIELLRWLLGRDCCGQVLINRRYKEIKTHLSDAVDCAHDEYGELMYPAKANMCTRHGVLYSDEQS